MSHDIRTPMNAILGMSRLALDEPDSAVVHDYLGKICESGGYLLGLINDILDMSKIESDHVELYCEPYSIKSCIDFVLTSMRMQMDQKNITFTYREPQKLGRPILADRMRLQQVFFNLLSNAVKFTPEEGTISVSVEVANQTPDEVSYRIAVSDNGVGISQQNLQRIFEPFEQVTREKEAMYRGSGLGLAIVNNLVHLMGGTIEVESDEGHGTTFTVSAAFPLAEEAALEKDDQKLTAQDYDFAGKKVLLVEDHPVNMEIAMRMLERKHCAVGQAVNGQEALDVLAASKPGEYQAIFMDIRMPVMGGLEAARCVRTMEREDVRSLPIIAMTANAFEEDVRKSLAAGMDAHLAKPIQMDLLYQTLQKVWSNR